MKRPYHLLLLAGCKDLASSLSCTARLIYKTAVICERTFLKSFMGNEKPNCGYVNFCQQLLLFILIKALFFMFGKTVNGCSW